MIKLAHKDVIRHPDEVDEAIRPLCDVINLLTGCETVSSCGGHEDRGTEFYVLIEFSKNGDGWDALRFLSAIINELYQYGPETDADVSMKVKPLSADGYFDRLEEHIEADISAYDADEQPDDLARFILDWYRQGLSDGFIALEPLLEEETQDELSRLEDLLPATLSLRITDEHLAHATLHTETWKEWVAGSEYMQRLARAAEKISQEQGFDEDDARRVLSLDEDSE
jgi:hypothetical protein